MVIKKCKICGKEFDARGSTVTCSSECRKINKREYQREWQNKNPEYMKKWHENNPEYMKKWYENNPEYDKQRYINNRDKFLKWEKEYRLNNPDKVRKNDYRKKKRKVEHLISEFDGDIDVIKKYCPSKWLIRELEMLINYNVSYFNGMIAKIESTPVCEATGSNKNLVIHHLESYNIHPELGADPNNMVRITEDIHKEFHSIYGYGNNTREQWNEFINNR